MSTTLTQMEGGIYATSQAGAEVLRALLEALGVEVEVEVQRTRTVVCTPGWDLAGLMAQIHPALADLYGEARDAWLADGAPPHSKDERAQRRRALRALYLTTKALAERRAAGGRGDGR